MPHEFRRIDSGPTDPFLNMGVDEALMKSPGSPPTLRFYAWRPACLSLGYFQKIADFDVGRVVRAGGVVTRRITGGGAIYHDDELTYAVTAGEDHPLIGGNIRLVYRRFHEAIAVGLRRLGVAPEERGTAELDSDAQGETVHCFEKSVDLDLAADGRKLVGSAQRRSKGRFLMHGSIIIGVSDMVPSTGSIKASSGVEDITYDDVSEAVLAGLVEHLDIKPVRGGLTKAEREKARILADRKYGAKWWIEKF